MTKTFPLFVSIHLGVPTHPVLRYITECIDSGDSVDVLYLDFAKAFDKVSHNRLLRKLEAHGVDGMVLGWIRAWLSLC